MAKKIRNILDLTEKQYIALEQKAEKLGHEHGVNAAQWIAQDSWGGRARGGEDTKTAQAFLDGYDAGDPAILDFYNEPNLSGEYADSWTTPTLYNALGLPEDYEDDSTMALSLAYEHGSSEGFWDTLTQSARAHLNLNNPRSHGREKKALLSTGYKLLRSDAIVLEAKPSDTPGWYILLALRVNQGEYVTWAASDSEELQSGHYFVLLAEALQDFNSRR